MPRPTLKLSFTVNDANVTSYAYGIEEELECARERTTLIPDPPPPAYPP